MLPPEFEEWCREYIALRVEAVVAQERRSSLVWPPVVRGATCEEYRAWQEKWDAVRRQYHDLSQRTEEVVRARVSLSARITGALETATSVTVDGWEFGKTSQGQPDITPPAGWFTT